MKYSLCYAGSSIVAVLALYAGVASADGSFINTSSFNNNAALTASALNATIASSSISFQPCASIPVAGNQLMGVANGAVGAIGIIQNNGSNSNVQQSIVVKIDNLSATVTH